MRLDVFTPIIHNYRGQGIAAIAQSSLPIHYKHRLTRQLPEQVTYDEYVGLVGVLWSGQHPEHIWRTYNRLFRRSSLFSWADDVIDYINRLLT